MDFPSTYGGCRCGVLRYQTSASLPSVRFASILLIFSSSFPESRPSKYLLCAYICTRLRVRIPVSLPRFSAKLSVPCTGDRSANRIRVPSPFLTVESTPLKCMMLANRRCALALRCGHGKSGRRPCFYHMGLNKNNTLLSFHMGGVVGLRD